jgi:hypothetical protein
MSDGKQAKDERGAWGSRLLAGLGFALALILGGLAVSRQTAMTRAQNYVRDRYNTDVEVPVRDVKPTFIDGPTRAKRSRPPFGFCWTIQLEAGSSQAEVTIDPWTYEVIDWEAEL